MKENDWQLLRYFLLWSVLPFIVALSFYEIYRIREKYAKIIFFSIISFALLPSSRFNLHVYFRQFCQTTFIEMPSLNRYEKVTCDNCGTQTTKLNLARHKKSCSAGTLCYNQCPNFSTKSQKMIWIFILLRSTAPQNLMPPSSVNFGIKSFQDFTLYVNIETLNTACRSDPKQEMQMWND